MLFGRRGDLLGGAGRRTAPAVADVVQLMRKGVLELLRCDGWIEIEEDRRVGAHLEDEAVYFGLDDRVKLGTNVGALRQVGQSAPRRGGRIHPNPIGQRGFQDRSLLQQVLREQEAPELRVLEGPAYLGLALLEPDVAFAGKEPLPIRFGDRLALGLPGENLQRGVRLIGDHADIHTRLGGGERKRKD